MFLQAATPTPQAAPHSGMETEELISTLPELGDELNSDIMQTILNSGPAAKAENGSLTWLWADHKAGLDIMEAVIVFVMITIRTSKPCVLDTLSVIAPHHLCH